MWWPGKSQEKSAQDARGDAAKATTEAVKATGEAAKKTAEEEVFNANLPNREKLPPALQKIVDKSDKEDNFFDELVDGYAPESTESNVRFAAYASRIRTILLSAHRYVAYTSDIGESFRPVAHPWLVRGAYGVSWAYVLGDVSYEGYKAYWHNQRILNPRIELTARQKKLSGIMLEPAGDDNHITPGVVTPIEDYRTVMAQRAIFQSIASMGLPAFTIHSVVRYSGRAMKDLKNKTVRTWGPIGLGLAVVPFLPTLFDKPVEDAVEFAFHKGFEAFGGKQAVGETPIVGREKKMIEKTKPKEKEL